VLKFLPKFEYQLDEATAKAAHLMQLLDEIN
jgi:ribosome-binding factor A